MARMEQRDDYTQLSDREIAGTGIGTSPAAVAAYNDLQRAVYDDQPQDTKEALETGKAADQKAQGAQASADQAQASADDAGGRADAAQGSADAAQASADDAYALADTKVSKDATPKWGVPSGTLSRDTFATYAAPTASATYDAAQVQALMATTQLLSRIVAALVTDLAAIDALKS